MRADDPENKKANNITVENDQGPTDTTDPYSRQSYNQGGNAYGGHESYAPYGYYAEQYEQSRTQKPGFSAISSRDSGVPSKLPYAQYDPSYYNARPAR